MPTDFAAECMACIVGRQVRQIPQAWSDAKRAAYLREVLRLIAEADPAEPGPEVTRRIDDLTDAWGVPRRDFGPEKRRFNALMVNLLPRLRSEIDAAPDPLWRAMELARTANYIDFDAIPDVDEGRLLELLSRTGSIPPEGGEYARFREDLARAESIAYVTDNCGEIAVDRLLIERLRAMHPALRVTAIVRGGDAGNDATREDAAEVGLEEAAEVVDNGNALMGTFLNELSPIARDRLYGADMVVSKGQANFESLCGSGLNIYYLFLCKCDRFQRFFHIERLAGVLANERRLPGKEVRP